MSPLLLLSNLSVLLAATTLVAGADITTNHLIILHSSSAVSGDILNELLVTAVGSSAAKKTSVPLASGKVILSPSTYVLRAAIGTPPQPFLLAMDTSNDAAWIPCSGCSGCPSSTFYPANSSTFVVSGGSFNLTYGGSVISADLSRDTLTLAGADAIAGYSFGCIRAVTGGSLPPQGLLGLGRGAMSLPSQTRGRYAATFSYCLPSFRSLNFSGSLRLGVSGQPKHIKTTPLLSNPHRPTLYYANLTGVRVGGRPVASPSLGAFDPVTGAGTVFDSGTMFTRLVSPLYAAVRDSYRARVAAPSVSSLGGFDTCFEGPVSLPTITMEFAGGMSVTLPEENVVIRSSFRNVSCLAMAAAEEGGGVNSVLNVIASWQQQNHRVLYDVPNSRIGVSREDCTAAGAGGGF